MFYHLLFFIFIMCTRSSNKESISNDYILKMSTPDITDDIYNLRNECIYYLIKYNSLKLMDIINNMVSNSENYREQVILKDTNEYGVFIYSVYKGMLEELKKDDCDSVFLIKLNECLIQHHKVIVCQTDSVETVNKNIDVTLTCVFCFEKTYNRLRICMKFRKDFCIMISELLIDIFLKRNKNLSPLICFFQKYFNKEKIAFFYKPIYICGIPNDIEIESLLLSDSIKHYKLEKFSVSGLSKCITDMFKYLIDSDKKDAIIYLNFDFTNLIYLEIIKNYNIKNKIDFKRIAIRLLKYIEIQSDTTIDIFKNYKSLTEKKINAMMMISKEYCFTKLIDKLNLHFREDTHLRVFVFDKNYKESIESFVIKAFNIFKSYLDSFASNRENTINISKNIKSKDKTIEEIELINKNNFYYFKHKKNLQGDTINRLIKLKNKFKHENVNEKMFLNIMHNPGLKQIKEEEIFV